MDLRSHSSREIIAFPPLQGTLDDTTAVQSGFSPTESLISPNMSQVTFDCTDIENLMLPLQLLHSQFIASLDHSLLQTSGLGEHAVHDLIDLVQSSWLRHEMEALLCWGHEAAARLIRQRQRQRVGKGPGPDPQGHIPLELAKESEESCLELPSLYGETAVPQRRTRLKSHVMIVTTLGTLQIHLRKTIGAHDSDLLRLSFMPAAKVRTRGISAAFARNSNLDSPLQISPQIKTFNVVPQDSAIIQCVSCNDLHGVRKLFDAGLASPLDVDPCGFSLLSVSFTKR